MPGLVLAGDGQDLLVEVVGVAVDEIDDRQQDVDLARLQEPDELGRPVVARDADEAGLARLLLLQEPGVDAVGVQGNVDLAVAGLVEIDQVDVVGLQDPERIGEDLLGRGNVVGHDFGREEDLLAAAAEGQAHALFADVVGGGGVDGRHARGQSRR